MLESVTFLEGSKDFRKGILRPGETIKFIPGLNLLVGDQGSGKSSLCALIGDKEMRKKDAIYDYKTTDGLPVNVGYFDTEKKNPRILSYFDKAWGGYQVQAMFSSHGEAMKPILLSIGNISYSGLVLVVDEPESALSLRSIYKLIDSFNIAAEKGAQLIVATHHPTLIESVDTVFSLEHWKWMNPKEFLETQRCLD